MDHSIVAFVLSVVTVLSGCASVQVYKLDQSTMFPATHANSVKVYPSADSVPGDFVEVAELEGEGTVFNSKGGIIAEFKEEAAAIGANGLIMRGYESQGAFDIKAGPNKSAKAIAIRVQLESQSQAEGE